MKSEMLELIPIHELQSQFIARAERRNEGRTQQAFIVNSAMQRLSCQYLYLCTRKASKLNTSEAPSGVGICTTS